MVSQEIVCLDLNELEKEEVKSRKFSNDVVMDYERYISEKDELVIQTLSERDLDDMEFSNNRKIISKDDMKTKKIRLPCHMNETMYFCLNVCKYKNICSHRQQK